MSDDKALPAPIAVSFGGTDHSVATVRELYDLLTTNWPEEARGPRYEDATGACLKVLDGHRSVADAVDAFRALAAESGLPITD